MIDDDKIVLVGNDKLLRTQKPTFLHPAEYRHTLLLIFQVTKSRLRRMGYSEVGTQRFRRRVVDFLYKGGWRPEGCVLAEAWFSKDDVRLQVQASVYAEDHRDHHTPPQPNIVTTFKVLLTKHRGEQKTRPLAMTTPIHYYKQDFDEVWQQVTKRLAEI